MKGKIGSYSVFAVWMFVAERKGDVGELILQRPYPNMVLNRALKIGNAIFSLGSGFPNFRSC